MTGPGRYIYVPREGEEGKGAELCIDRSLPAARQPGAPTSGLCSPVPSYAHPSSRDRSHPSIPTSPVPATRARQRLPKFIWPARPSSSYRPSRGIPLHFGLSARITPVGFFILEEETRPPDTSRPHHAIICPSLAPDSWYVCSPHERARWHVAVTCFPRHPASRSHSASILDLLLRCAIHSRLESTTRTGRGRRSPASCGFRHGCGLSGSVAAGARMHSSRISDGTYRAQAASTLRPRCRISISSKKRSRDTSLL